MSTLTEAHRKAIPTEYQGVRFKSKSEAIFAHNLTLAGVFWEYEPDEFYSEDGWHPDFLIARRTKTKTDHKMRVSITLVEYKPSEPTTTYLELIRRRLQELDFGGFPVPLIVAYGSSFEPHTPRGLWMLESVDSEWKNLPHNEDQKSGCKTFLLAHLDESHNYRFDLKH